MFEEYAYDLPPELIARTPAEPRDSARLFVYDVAHDRVSFDTFANVARYLPSNAFLVLNKTKVVPSRVEVKKETGGKAELLLLVNELQPGDTQIKTLSDRRLRIGQKLFLTPELWFTVRGQDEKVFLLETNFPIADLTTVLHEHGKTPIPKYIGAEGMSEHELRQKYQTIFAQESGSVAAPTASLHFTPEVFERLESAEIPHTFVRLHVGLGTFAPIGEENLQSKKLFTEYCEVPPETAAHIAHYKKSGRRLLAVGTTTVRTLESAARSAKNKGADEFPAFKGGTDIFIFPPFTFKAVEGLITNFHLPESSLMMLVDAFLLSRGAQRRLRDLYKIAIAEKFRFYSFGDAMLIV